MKKFIDPITGIEYGIIGNGIIETMAIRNLIIGLIPFCFINSLYRKLKNGVWPKYNRPYELIGLSEKEQYVLFIQPDICKKIKVPYTTA